MRAPGHHRFLPAIGAGLLVGMATGALAAPVKHEARAEVASQPAAEPATLDVMVDIAKVVRLPERAQTVVVGNPGIAEVTVQKNGIMILTGKSFGTTNLIVLDSTGNLLAESNIRVENPRRDSTVTLLKGAERESYSCSPNCSPSMRLGDSSAHFDQVGAQVGKRNGLATGK